MFATKVKGLSIALSTKRRLLIHGHTADGIFKDCCGGLHGMLSLKGLRDVGILFGEGINSELVVDVPRCENDDRCGLAT